MALPNKQSVVCPCFKLVILGDGRTGKTSLLRKHLSGDFTRRYYPTIRVEVHPLEFFTNNGKIRFECWDAPGYVSRSEASNLGQWMYSVRAQCAIIMFCVTESLTFKNVPKWHHDLFRAYGNIPVILCGNKVDKTLREVTEMQVRENRILIANKILEYFEISTKTSYNIEIPFLYLAKELTRHAKLTFVESPALYPPEVQIDLVMQKKHDAELADAAKLPLPDNDDVIPIPPHRSMAGLSFLKRM